jgi:hypothetical protein
MLCRVVSATVPHYLILRRCAVAPGTNNASRIGDEAANMNS